MASNADILDGDAAPGGGRNAMLEYVQTEQDRWNREDAGAEAGHKILLPPVGEGWELHSWRPSPQNSTKLLMVWQRKASPR